MLSLSLRARAPHRDPDELFAIVEGIIGGRERLAGFERVELEGGASMLLATIHPAAGPIELVVSPGLVVLDVMTSTAGPGLHVAVVEIADAIAEALALAWTLVEDRSGYFETRDVEALVRAMREDVASAARDILALVERGGSGFALSMPAGLEVSHDELVATPLGPRDRPWVERAAADPSAADDVFPWPRPGHDARYHLGVALTLLWLEVRWRKPTDDGERAVLERVVTELELAHGLDPKLVFPWAAWAECFALLGEESLRSTRAQFKASEPDEQAAPLIGYRRNAVRVMLSGGWSIAIPGTFSERWDERGTWVGADERRGLWVTSAEAPEGYDTEATLAGLPPLEGEGDVHAMTRGPIRGEVRFEVKEENGVSSHVGHAHAALGPHLIVGTFVARDKIDRAMLLEMWGSLDHPDAASETALGLIQA